MEFTYLLTVNVASQDADLARLIPDFIRNRFDGTAVTVTACEPVNALNPVWRAGWRAAVTSIAEG